MGKYTALDDPSVDQLIERHQQRIVAAVRGRMEPKAIILRGSFGRGEGSVLRQKGELIFLSDYEIDVATYSPFHRALFAELTRTLSAELCVQTGLRWARPDCFSKERLGPITTGPAALSISLYELRYGSQVLYGEDFVNSSGDIDPAQIRAESGLRLLLNRMAESLVYMPLQDEHEDENLSSYHWINKTTLACAESLLLLWKEYHYSYKERGKRFALLAKDHLGFMPEKQACTLEELVAQATEFKLRPRVDIYQESIRQCWLRLLPLCDAVLRWLTGQILQFSFEDYYQYPQQYLEKKRERGGLRSTAISGLQRTYETYRALKAQSYPRFLFSPFHASHIVYAVVPVVFQAYDPRRREGSLGGARKWIGRLGPLKARCKEQDMEWDYLRRKLTDFWKIYCY